MNSQHPEAKCTLSELFERHYFKDDMRPATLNLYRICLRRWERETGHIAVRDATNETVALFRKNLIEAGLTPNAVNPVAVLREWFGRVVVVFCWRA